MSETIGPDDKDEQNKQFRAPESLHIRLEGKPGPFIEDPEKRKQPGEMIETVDFQDSYYAKGMLVRSRDGRIGQIFGWEVEPDEPVTHPTHIDPSIKRPKKPTNPKFLVSYPDGTVAEYGFRNRPIPLYREKVLSAKGFEKQIEMEIRGHQYQLGELVSFGNGVGKLAMIMPGETEEETLVGLVAQKEYGKSGPLFVWKVRASEIDYLIYEEKDGIKTAIKRNPDNTIFKPTLEKE